MTSPRTAVVIGGTGGIGAALVERLAGDPGWQAVVATSRRATPADGRVQWIEADLTDDGAPAAIADSIAATTDRVHLFITATGLLHDDRQQPEKNLRAIDGAALTRSFAVNAAAPLAVFAACRDLLTHEDRSVAALLSARVGSIGDNALGGWYAYRMAKAALNMGVRTAAIELSRQRKSPILCALHPGTTATALSEPFLGRRPHVDAEECADRMLDLLGRIDERSHGLLLNWDGDPLPW